MSDQTQFVLVRRDTENHVEIIKKSDFDATGYSFLKNHPTYEEWVESDRLEYYQNLENGE